MSDDRAITEFCGATSLFCGCDGEFGVFDKEKFWEMSAARDDGVGVFVVFQSIDNRKFHTGIRDGDYCRSDVGGIRDLAEKRLARL